MRSGNYDEWRDYPAAAIEDCRQQETLNWMCLAGARRATSTKRWAAGLFPPRNAGNAGGLGCIDGIAGGGRRWRAPRRGR